MKSLKIIFFGSPYYSVPLLDKTIELGHDAVSYTHLRAHET